MPGWKAPLAVALALAAPRAAAEPASFLTDENLSVLRGLFSHIRSVVETAQPAAVVPIVDFGDRRAARYRFRRRERIFAFDQAHQPVGAGWELRDVVETAEGSVDRLLEAQGDDGAATPLQERTVDHEKGLAAKEDRRLASLLVDPQKKAKLQQKERIDQRGLEEMVGDFPRALRFSAPGVERGADGEELLREGFESNVCSEAPSPGCYTPRSQEARIYAGMRGTVWVRRRDGHLVRFQTEITRDVKFGWGPFSATAKKGGVIAIELADMDGSGRRWVITALTDHLVVEKSPIAALFSGGTERDHDEQEMSAFSPVPEMSYDDGIRLLLGRR